LGVHARNVFELNNDSAPTKLNLTSIRQFAGYENLGDVDQIASSYNGSQYDATGSHMPFLSNSVADKLLGRHLEITTGFEITEFKYLQYLTKTFEYDIYITLLNKKATFR